MFNRLGIFAILAVCLFAIVIVMGGCGNGDDENGPPLIETAEETFKEQLVEGEWRVVSFNDEHVETFVQELEDEISQDLGFQFKGTEFQNSFRFSGSGTTTWELGIKLSLPDVIEFRFLFTIKGSYFVNEDSGSSAIMSLSFTEIAAQLDGEDFDVPERTLGVFHDVAHDGRASINGDQLRIGDSLLERN